jgi:hypothetical protein
LHGVENDGWIYGITADRDDARSWPLSYLQLRMSRERRAGSGLSWTLIRRMALHHIACAWERPSSDGSGEQPPKLRPMAITLVVKLHELLVQPRLRTKFLVAHRVLLGKERTRFRTSGYPPH